MDTGTFDPNAIMLRAQAGLEAERSKGEATAYEGFKLFASASGIAIACASEAWTLTTALKAQFQALSDGTDLGTDMMAMRPGVIAVLLLTHVILHDGGENDSRPHRRWLRRFRAIPILAIISGMAVFMFMATSTATGGEDGSGGLTGAALGVACGSMFAISFMASNALMRKFLPALRTILAGRAQRAKIADLARELDAVDDCRARIEAGRRAIAAKEAPDALRRTVAAEAAGIIGQVAAEAHDIYASCEAMGGDLGPDDVVIGLPDTPLTALDQRATYLKGLDVPFFLNLLKTKEA